MSDGFIAYQGPSVLSPDTAIRYTVTNVRRKSKNPKTGGMVQCWATVVKGAPQEVLGTLSEGAICGAGRYACPHSGQRDGSCYVIAVNAPRATWSAAKAGSYSRSFGAMLEALRGRLVRHGAYGDPTAIPWLVFKAMCDSAAGWTAYTQQHARGRFERFKAYAMASCNNLEQAREAQARGWRTFRVLQPGEVTVPGEILCPASAEAGKRTTCAACLLCNGARPNDRRANIAIYAHGGRASRMWRGDR